MNPEYIEHVCGKAGDPYENASKAEKPKEPRSSLWWAEQPRVTRPKQKGTSHDHDR